jgi:hypothetical protein
MTLITSKISFGNKIATMGEIMLNKRWKKRDFRVLWYNLNECVNKIMIMKFGY